MQCALLSGSLRWEGAFLEGKGARPGAAGLAAPTMLLWGPGQGQASTWQSEGSDPALTVPQTLPRSSWASPREGAVFVSVPQGSAPSRKRL